MGKNNRGKNTFKSNHVAKNSSNSFANLETESENDVYYDKYELEKDIDNSEQSDQTKNMCVVEGREENGDEKWTCVETKKPKTRKNIRDAYSSSRNNIYKNDVFHDDMTNEIYTEDCIDDGSDFKFNMKWYIWTHLSESLDWSPNSYKHIYTIESMKNFWEFFGNLDKLDILKHHFYIMRETSGPTWEHPSNRGGGICSLRLQKDKVIELVEQIAIFIINESLLENNLEINGFSVSAKHMWGVIKIWNKSSENDISPQLPQYMIRKYSLSPRYGSNKPEY